MENQKRVLIIGWFFFPKLGGVESLMIEQVRYFKKKGYEVAVITSLVEGMPNDDMCCEAKIYRRSFMDSGVEFDLREIEQELLPIIQEFGPNLVHFHNGSYPSGSKNMQAGGENVKKVFSILKREGIKIVDHAHNAQLKNPKATAGLRELEWDYLIFVSDFVRREWKKLGYSANKSVVVHNGVDADLYSRGVPSEIITRKKGQDIALFFPSRVVSISQGILSSQKNFILVLKSCGLLLDRGVGNFKLFVVLKKSLIDSKGEVFDNLIKLINDYHLNDKVIFIPEVSSLEMPNYYAAVDVVCVPSIKEAFSLTYLETMAAGKIPIASNTGGSLECIENGKNGFLVSPDDAGELADVLENLIKDATLRTKISAEAAKSSANFTLDVMMEKIDQVYDSLLAE